ncbi:uncharacterized protein LOC132196753 [Neocloeon triangulifer]|uniref:uncharacterized protein LOC132196753 n=1 Tax=Neocloeon triangulifer TaxID=2078957 RepID=UPI00286F8CFB|nr:uncharacterized protein LOC132196753 [Neocloeon triangulifer]
MANMIKTLLLLLYGSLLSAGRTTPTQCSTYCTDNSLSLEKGSTLEYSYSGWAETTLRPHSSLKEDHDPSSGLLLNATVVIRVVSPCEISLKLKDVQLSGESKGAVYADLLTHDTVRASIQGGNVETVCSPQGTDTAGYRWALNVKKAILSALQLPLRALDSSEIATLHETDVSGVCRTQYQSLQTENSTLVTKTKNLAHCAGRSGNIDLETPSAGFKSSPAQLLRGEQHCIKTVSGGRLLFSHCKEAHVLQPFSTNNGTDGVTTTVHQTLVLEKVTEDESAIESLPLTFTRSSLLFEHGDHEDILENEKRSAEALLEAEILIRELSGDSANVKIRPESSKLFGELVRVMDKLDENHLRLLVAELEMNNVERDFVMDALQNLNNQAGITIISALYMEREKQIPKLKLWLESKAAKWFASLAYSHRVDDISIRNLNKLLVYTFMGHTPESDVSSIVLGITGLARTYCEQTGGMATCELRIYEIISTLEQVLLPEFHASEKIRIIAMKGLGNIGVFITGSTHLQEIISNELLSIDERLAALDAFRRVPCSKIDASTFLEIFADTNQDTEIRIAAYLTTVKCPSPAIVRAIKKALYSETVNQVGSFVWTHLTNSQESTGKGRQVLRSLLANEFLQNKFRTDVRQFSRNFEGSHHFESLGLGANADSNIIFSTKSYLPRSAMLNLTVDIFGESINLLEIGGRAQGFEPMIERLFSKKGVFENEALENFLKNARKDEQYDSIMNITTVMQKGVKPRASGYLRFNGQEVSFLELEDVLQNAYQFNIHPRELIKSLLSSREFEFARSEEILNTKREFPTVIGLPLKLALNGTSSVNLALKGHFEKSNAGFEISAYFKPSASVALTGTMSVGQDDFEQGVKFETTLFTQTSLDNKLIISNEGKINFKSQVPEEKQTLIDLKTERLIFNGERVKKLPDLVAQRETSSFCTGEWVDGLLGLKFCSDMSYPNSTLEEKTPSYPLNGDSHIIVTVEKTDPTFKAYEFTSSWAHIPGRKYDYSVSFDRVGSELPAKRRSITLVFDREAGVAVAALDIPEKQAEISVLWDGKDYSAAEVSISYDRVNYVEVLAKLDHQKKIMPGTKEQFGKIEPEIKFKVQNFPEFYLKGIINYSGKSKFTADLNVAGLTQKPLAFAIDYNADASSGAVNARVSVDSQYITWDVKANAKITPSTLGLRVNGVYNLTSEEHHSLEIMAKYNWNQQGALKRGFLNLKSQLSQWPQYSGQLQSDVMLSKGYYEGNLRLTLTNEEWNVTQRFQATGGADVWIKQTIECPKRSINFLLEHRHKYIPNVFSTTSQLNVDQTRSANFHLDYKYIQGDGITFSAESALLWPRITFSTGIGPNLKSRVRQVLPGEYDAFLTTQWTETREPVIIKAVYKDKSSHKKISHFLNGTMTGAFGFAENKELGVQGNFEAVNQLAKIEGRVAVGGEKKSELTASYEVDKLGKKSMAAKMSVFPTSLAKKDYEIFGSYYKSLNEMALSVDLVMSRHLSFKISTSSDNDELALFWDKANDTNKNVTLLIEYPRLNEFAANLMVPGQNISVSGHLRQISSASKSDDTTQLSGHALGAKLKWYPGREIFFSGNLKGNFELGIETLAEIGVKNVPVVGSQFRVFEVEFVPPREKNGKLVFQHAWRIGEKRLENLEAKILIEKRRNDLSLEVFLHSTVWNPKNITGSVKSTFNNWSDLNANVSVNYGEKRIYFACDWNLSHGAKFEVQSNLERISSAALELQYNIPHSSKSGALKHWITLKNAESIWSANVILKNNKTLFAGDYELEFNVITPMESLERHFLAAALRWDKKEIDCSGQLETPLTGNFAFQFANRQLAESQKHNGKLLIFSSDKLVMELEILAKRIPIDRGLDAEIILQVPEILHVKSEVLVDIKERGGSGKINFFNQNRLLHDIRLNFQREHQNDSVKFDLDFSGYSYLLMASRWKLKVKHEGTKQNHTSYLEVNKFTLDHKFEYNKDDESWKFELKGIADNRDVIKVSMQHYNWLFCKHFINIMGKEVIDINSHAEQGFVHLNFLDKILQIHTRITDADEIQTATKIFANHKLYATAATSTFLRYKENDGGLESAIINVNVDANRNNAKLQVNVDAWRRVTTKVSLSYDIHKVVLDVDVLSANNTIDFSYYQDNIPSIKLQTFVYYELPSAAVGLDIQSDNFLMRIDGEGTMDEEMMIYATGMFDFSGDFLNICPINIEAEWQLPKSEVIQTGGRILVKSRRNSTILLKGHLNYEEFNKHLNGSILFTSGNEEDYHENKYEVLLAHQSLDKQYLLAQYKFNDEKVELEIMLAEMLFEAKLLTPVEDYQYLSLKAGVAERSAVEKRFLEYIKNDYKLEADLIFNKNKGKSKMLAIAKANNGFEVEAVVEKIETDASTDVFMTIELNKANRVEAGALLEYELGNLNITANVTRDGTTQRMRSRIYNTEQLKSFAIMSEFMENVFEMEIYSSVDSEIAYEQGFKIATQSLTSEFRYEKSENISIAYLQYQEQVLQCVIKGNTMLGMMSISHKNSKVSSDIQLDFDFEDKINVEMSAYLNKNLDDSEKSEPLNFKANIDPSSGTLHLSMRHRLIKYLLEGTFQQNEENIKLDAALITPYFESTRLNVSYDFENNKRIIEIHFEYGKDFYNLISHVHVDGSYSFNLNMDAKSSVPDYETMKVRGEFKNSDQFSGVLKLELPTNTYILSIEYKQGKSCSFKLATDDNVYVLNYASQANGVNLIEFYRDSRQLFNATFVVANETLLTTIMTPHEKYNNLTLYVGYGSNLPNRNLIIHKNNDVLFKAHMYPIDQGDIIGGTGIMATIYQGDQQFVYDAQFSVDNPVYIVLKQHEAGNVSRDILHFSLNVTNESSASGRAEILLPLSPNTKLLAKGQIQIENKNAEFKMSYKFDEEEENNFAIHYKTFTDHYNIYNIVTNMTTPFKGYESMSLAITSSWTETVVKFSSQLPGYENIALVAVHRLEGPQKELWVQFQNMKKSIFYVKALFLNEANNKRVELKTRTPFLNGQALASNNGSVMEIMLEHEGITLVQIVSKLEEIVNGKKYEFTFKKPERVFLLESRFVKELNIEFSLNTQLDNELIAGVIFKLDALGKIVSTLKLMDHSVYKISGTLSWLKKSLDIHITNDIDFNLAIDAELRNIGHLKISSDKIQHAIQIGWKFTDAITNFNLTQGNALDLNFEATDSSVQFKFIKSEKEYSFAFGQTRATGWPNILLKIVWDSETLIDFLHDFLTDHQFLIVRTKLTSPFLGNHKNMKFSLTLKTKDRIEVEAEFKWRPKDFTLFNAALIMGDLASTASLSFISPFSSNFTFNAQYDFSGIEKTFEIIYSLVDIVSLQGAIIPSGNDQSITIKLKTPIEGYTYVELSGFHKVIGKTQRAELQLVREDQKKSVEINFDGRNVRATVNTPEMRWSIIANYLYTQDTHKVEGNVKWGGAKDVMMFETHFKPREILYIRFTGPQNEVHKLDYKMTWTKEKKTIEIAMQKNKEIAEFNGGLTTQENLHILVAHMKMSTLKYIKVSAILNSKTNELGGAIQIDEDAYSMKASEVIENTYNIKVFDGETEKMELNVAFDGEYHEALKILVNCITPNYKFTTEGTVTITNEKLQISTSITWGDENERISFSYKNSVSTEIKCMLNTANVQDSEIYLSFGTNFVNVFLRNQSDTYKAGVTYTLNEISSINGTFEVNGKNYELVSYYDPMDIKIHVVYVWPLEQRIAVTVVLKPGNISLMLKTPYIHFTNIQINGKYSEVSTYNDYQLASKADAKWNDYLISLTGVIKKSHNNYGLDGSLVWDNANEIKLNFGVIDNKFVNFELKTPFKGLPIFSANLEALKYRHAVTGISGKIQTPFEKLPILQFIFNRADEIIEMQFAFDTATYKNISIHTKLTSKNSKYLFMQINAPFVSKVKYFVVDARSNKLIGKNGQTTKITLQLDEKLYEIENNYTVLNGRLNSSVFMKGPSNKNNPINVNFGGKFEMNSLDDLEMETFFNEALLGLQYKLEKDLQIKLKVHLSSVIALPKTEFALHIVRSSHFEGKIDYSYGKYIGNALVKNKFQNSTLETIMYLNLPQILKYPLQVQLTANYIQPRLQFNGFASYMAQHRLELIMVQTSFRTTLNAKLDSAFFKGTNNFELILSSGTLSVSMNDEIKITGLKNLNQLVLTLSQISKKQDHSLTYEWDLTKPPTFEVTLESPILTSKKAKFSATYLGALKGVNIKLVSGSESLKLDYDVINKNNSKGIKIVIGNSQAQILNFAAYLEQVPNGNKLLAEMTLFEIVYKAAFKYSLPDQNKNPKLDADLFLSLPYLFPFKLLSLNLKTGKDGNAYFILSNISLDNENIDLDGLMTNDLIKVEISTSFEELKSLLLEADYSYVGNKKSININLFTNDSETLKTNISFHHLSNGFILQVDSESVIKNFEKLSLKLTIPSEIRYSLQASLELRGSTHFDGQMMFSSKPGYTNLELKFTGLSINMYLTSNQGFFGYKTKYDDYSMKIYSKSSGHQLESEVTFNSGQVQLFKAGLFGMYNNQTDFYVLMSTNSIYETLPDTVFYVGAKKTEIKFGTELDYKLGEKESYSVILNHFIESTTDFDIGLMIESSKKEAFIAKIKHVLKDDFYIAFAQVNKDIIKITKINQNSATLLSGTVHCDDFDSEVSGKLVNEEKSKGIDLKLTWNKDLYQIGGSYNYSENEFIIVKFHLNSPQTQQYTGAFEYSEPANLYILLDQDQSPLLIVELNSEKVRSKYLLLNTTDVKLMLSEYHHNSAYELLASVFYDSKTIKFQYDSDTFPESPDSYKINATFVAPQRTVGFNLEKYLSDNHNVSQFYICWENLYRRVGYTIDITKDQYKTNLKTAIEIPNRAIDFKTHYKLMEIPEEVMDFEFGVQFNWNSKMRLLPLTFVTTVKVDHEQKVAYHYTVLAHPSFNSSYVIDGKMTKPNAYDNFFAVKMGQVENGKMSPALTLKINATRKSSSSQYHLTIENPRSEIYQQWEVQINYENGLAATVTLLRGESRGYSSAMINYDTASKRVEVGLIHNELTAEVLGQLITDHANNKFGVHASASFDILLPPVTLIVLTEIPEKSHWLLSAEINVAPERSYLAEAKFTPYHISTLLATQEYEETTPALQAALTLNTTDTISFVAKYKASIWKNLTHDLIAPFNHAKLVTNEILAGMKDVFKEEIFEKFEAAIQSSTIRSAYQKIVDHTTSEFNSLRQDWASFRQLIFRAYNRDDFFIRTISDFVKNAFAYGQRVASDGLEIVCHTLWNFFTDTMPKLLGTIYKNSVEPLVSAFQKFSPTVKKFVRDVSSTWNEIQLRFSNFQSGSVKYIKEGVGKISKHVGDNIASTKNWANETKEWIMNEYIEPSRETLTEIANALEKFFKETNEFFVGLPRQIELYFMSLDEVQEAIKIYKSYASWFEEFRFSYYVHELQNELKIWYNNFLEDLRWCIGEYAAIIPKTISAIQGSYEEFMQMPSVIYLKIVYSKVNAKANYFWELWNMEQFVQELLIKMSDEIVTFIRKISESSEMDYRENILINEEKYNFNYDPMNGEVSGSVTLPITWKRFDQMPTLNEDMNEKFQNFRYSTLDKVYEMGTTGGFNWKDVVLRTLMPPFRTNALITVNGHVITFDGNHYKIKNMLCGSYILAADYVENSFAIVASYGHEEGKLAGHLSYLTLYTQTGNKVTIEVTPTSSRTDIDGQSKIYVNGTKVELPLVVDDFEFTRQGPKVVAVSEKGVGLHCNIVSGLCSLDLSGWYHGKVAGIAGSFDKEQGNDFAQPDGRVRESVVEFLDEWKVSGSSECEMPVKSKAKPKDTSKAACDQLFTKTYSALQPCFSRLDPEPFRIMCEQDVTDGVVSDKGPDCLAAEAYVEQCRFVGMDMSLPAYCSRCRLPGKVIPAGEIVVFDSSPKSRSPPPAQVADFVFLIENGYDENCLQGPQLFDLPAKIDSVLRSTLGINSTKFALVTFGAGKPFTVHTLDGNIWSGRRGIQNALNKWQLPKPEQVATNQDLYQALLATASKLHFRPGASKNLILAPCTSCDRSEQTVDMFSEASGVLMLADIRLHVLQRDEMMFKRTITKKTKQGKVNPVMGFDTHGAYTGRRHKGTSWPLGSKAIMRQLSLPKDLCTPLALETNGTLFSASRLFGKGSSDDKRKWLDVWSRRVASSAKPTACQSCDCIPLPDGSSRLSCQSCLLPEIEIFLDEWERALEEAMQEDLDEDYDSIEMPDASGTLSDLESEREAINAVRDAIVPGHAFRSDSA